MPEVRLLPPDVFLHTFTLVPRAAVSLLVLGEGGALLTRRSEAMETMPGAWHLPGAFVLLNEPLPDCVVRVARKELGAEVVSSRPFGFFEDLDGDPRGHVIDLIFEVELDGDPHPTEETGEVRFFAQVPENVAFYHDRILRAAGLP